jgi:hypothetical protein
MFESRLWVRAGKQSIVWGKTELFRTTDQFNPQDLALATLPRLEESRISLWSVRGVWSFFTVGPFEDVRLEVAANIDDFEPNDIGRCGEPYTPFPACNKTAGLFAHGVAGFGLAGEVRPPDALNAWEGVEAGARLEFRWQRFSFALTNFYGYEDLPWIDPVFQYERNVDPETGRPRRGNSRDGCDPDGLFDGDVRGCLGPDDDARRNHHANLSRFAVICGASVGFSDIDPSVCAQSVFNSPEPFALGSTVGELLGWFTAGSETAAFLVGNGLDGAGGGLPDPADRAAQPGPGRRARRGHRGDLPLARQHPERRAGGAARLRALLGHELRHSRDGVFGGIDLLNADLSVLAQSWVGAPGTSGDWDATDPTLVQPGTLGFQGGPAGRWCRTAAGSRCPARARPSPPRPTSIPPAGWPRWTAACGRTTRAAPARRSCGIPSRASSSRPSSAPSPGTSRSCWWRSRASASPPTWRAPRASSTPAAAGRSTSSWPRAAAARRLLAGEAPALLQRAGPLRGGPHHPQDRARRRQRPPRPPAVRLARRRLRRAALREAQRARALDGLRRGPHQVHLELRGHLDPGHPLRGQRPAPRHHRRWTPTT